MIPAIRKLPQAIAILTLSLTLTLTVVGAKRLARADADVPCLFHVAISPESRVELHRGTAPARLRQGAWQSFRVCFDNGAKVTAIPHVRSPNAPAGKDRDHWVDVRLEPFEKRLSGNGKEYRTLLLRSRDAGFREATFGFDVGQGTEDLGFRGQASVLFQCSTAPPHGERIGERK